MPLERAGQELSVPDLEGGSLLTHTNKVAPAYHRIEKAIAMVSESSPVDCKVWVLA